MAPTQTAAYSRPTVRACNCSTRWWWAAPVAAALADRLEEPVARARLDDVVAAAPPAGSLPAYEGALVGALDPRDFEASRDRELARRNETRADYERNRSLYERDAISLRDLEVVRRQFEVSEANLKQADKALADTRLYAPFDGKVADRLVENLGRAARGGPHLFSTQIIRVSGRTAAARAAGSVG